MKPLSLCYSMADQNVATTKTIGIYNVSRHLLRQLATSDRLGAMSVLTNATVTPDLGFTPPAHVRFEDHPEAIRSKLGRILWDQSGVYTAARRAGHDWLFLPKGYGSFLRRPTVPLAVYIHDIMPEYYQRQFPGTVPWLEEQYFCRSLAATLRQARVVFTNSHFSKSEILDLAQRLKLPAPDVTVVGYGFNTTAPSAPTAAPAPKENALILFCSKWPHKLTDMAVRLLEAWRQRSGFDGVIHCIGIFESGFRPSSQIWNWRGRIPPDQVRPLLRQARAIIYPSAYEGFGLPPAEAVLEGTCPVFSDIPPIREAMGGTGMPFRNHDADSFAEAMDRALAVPASTFDTWSKELLARHQWPNVLAKVMDRLEATSS